jgi:uncharacterized protein YndB with AHSA1/START domain
MNKGQFISKAEVSINTNTEKVWDALVDPEMVRLYMFGTNVSSAWTKGSSITWRGEWQGKQYEDKGKILDVTPGKLLQFNHYSPLSGEEDIPENYHTVTIKLEPSGVATVVLLEQDNNATEEAALHSENNWKMVLDSLKKLLEGDKK